MTEFRFKRQQIEELFGEDYDGIINFELMVKSIQDFEDLGLGAPSIALDTSNFNGIFDSSTTTLQIMADIVDDLTTADIPEAGGKFYYTDERVDDRVGTLIQNGVGLTWTYDDAAGTLTGDVSLAPFTTDDLSEGVVNLYYTDARVGTYISTNIIAYGYEEVSSSSTVTKTKTNFTGSSTNQTITLPTAGEVGREVQVYNRGTVKVNISGSTGLSELYANEDYVFTDTGSDWI